MDLNAMQKAIKEHLDSIRCDYQKAVKENSAALGIIEEGEAALPHGRRQKLKARTGLTTAQDLL